MYHLVDNLTHPVLDYSVRHKLVWMCNKNFPLKNIGDQMLPSSFLTPNCTHIFELQIKIIYRYI